MAGICQVPERLVPACIGYHRPQLYFAYVWELCLRWPVEARRVYSNPSSDSNRSLIGAEGDGLLRQTFCPRVPRRSLLPRVIGVMLANPDWGHGSGAGEPLRVVRGGTDGST